MGVGLVFMLELEEETKVFGREDVVQLTTNGMDGVERERASGQNSRPDRKWIWNGAAVGGNLPLVITNYAELEQLAEIFLQRKNLANAPFVGKSLPGSLDGAVGAGARTVTFPVREEVHAGAPVFGYVVSGRPLHVVAPVARANVICGAWGVTPGGDHDAVSHHHIEAFAVPAQGKGLNPKIGEARTAASGAKIGSRGIGDIGIQRATCVGGGHDHEAEISAQNFGVRHE